ncbi:hypothetical protein HDU87_000556 [Geranomyces variabilis]|uniref:Uncharacterized protein n=1 Tax=Geranomyces variabilis TaxID=109894 RepID=A0AAD5TCR7_9FUNG|nr:hypothetical protein HDU87_000556 [Geranomyces variabilis]
MSDDALVLKWGQSEDLVARICKHRNNYGLIRGVALNLVKFILIDKLWCSECETTIAHFFSDAGWCLESSCLEVLQSGTPRAPKRKEIAVVPRAVLKEIALFYEGQQAKFGGENQRLTKDLADLKNRLCLPALGHTIATRWILRAMETCCEIENAPTNVTERTNDVMRFAILPSVSLRYGDGAWPADRDDKKRKLSGSRELGVGANAGDAPSMQKIESDWISCVKAI